jgi:NAD(P)-dependent dehydrogenase (short-subunit alcohol dehydrogenase family)
MGETSLRRKSMASLADEVVVITGAGRGLGKAVSIQLAKEGSKVVAISRTKEELDALVHFIKQNGGDAVSFPTDVTDPYQVSNAFQQIDQVYGKVDILINSAGVGVFGDVDSLSIEDYRKAIDVNLMGTIIPSQEAFKRMKQRARGHIVNVVSSSGTKGRAKETAYAASKFGVQGFTMALQEEAKPFKIRVTSFRPGGINTTFWDNLRFHQPDPSKFMDVNEVAQFLVTVIKDWDTLVVDDIALNRSIR